MPCHERAFPPGLIAPSLFIVLSFLKNVKREHLTKMDFARIHLIECKSALFAARGSYEKWWEKDYDVGSEGEDSFHWCYPNQVVSPTVYELILEPLIAPAISMRRSQATGESMTSILPAKGVIPHMRGLSGSRLNMTGHRTGILSEEITRKVEPCHGTLL